ncbi:MAG TPA: nucleotide exchange factor GrpE [Verrucomicrobiales bacterium]|nr:nucleotide exchange factor GrpE [Verrucomicrobiales bacterium]
MSAQQPPAARDEEPFPDDFAPETEDPANDPLNQALMEAAQWKEVAMRSAAELDNYRKRMAREMQDTARFANAGLLETLLPVLDNFEYGLNAAKAESEKSNIYIGLSMVLKQIQDFLRDQGVEEVAATGNFDPNVHEAMTQQPSDTVPEGGIIYQTRKGYRLRERLLRPASVVLSSGPAKPKENA